MGAKISLLTNLNHHVSIRVPEIRAIIELETISTVLPPPLHQPVPITSVHHLSVLLLPVAPSSHYVPQISTLVHASTQAIAEPKDLMFKQCNRLYLKSQSL